MKNNSPTQSSPDKAASASERIIEERLVTIYGYSEDELADIIKHFRDQLPDYVKIKTSTTHLITQIHLTGTNNAVELLRFKMNKFQQQLINLFDEDLLTTGKKNISQVLGELLMERELTVSCAESCTGGNIAHKITNNPGSSGFFMGSVVSYSNEVKANVLNVSRNDLERFGAVSKPVAEQMAEGVAKMMRTNCSMATTGIAGPEGGTKFKPIGTVWISAHYNNQTVTELKHFDGDRNDVIESATNHAMFMLIKLLRNSYTFQEEINDD